MPFRVNAVVVFVAVTVLIARAGILMAAPELPRLEAVTIDGDVADWGPTGLRVPCLLPDSARVPDPLQSRASARFAWDDAGLLVAVEVIDLTPSEAYRASAAYTADSVELFLATDPDKSGNVQLILSPGRDPAHPAPRAFTFDNRADALRSRPIDFAWAVKQTGNGYVVEARLPWAAMDIRPASGVTVASRLYVNNDDGAGARTRFTWQPDADKGRFHPLTLAGNAASAMLDAPLAWTALDTAATTGRLNMIGPAALGQTNWQVRQGDNLLGVLNLATAGDMASGSLELPAGRSAGLLTIASEGHATLTVRDTLADAAADAIARVNGGRVGAAEKTSLAFARAEFLQHVFVGRSFPKLDFVDRGRVVRLLGKDPVITTRWLDADGRDVEAPIAPGRYAARSEITIPGRAKPSVLEHIFYRMPDGAGVPSSYDESAARIFAFALHGADATPTQIARVTERWWHGVRRTRGWSEPLPYKIHVPEVGNATGPRPLIVHLHGSGQHSELAVSERLPLLAKLAGPEPIVLYPQSPTGWRGPAVGELIDSIVKQYTIDPNRIYLIGFSLGGMGSWEVALDQPDRFAAVVPIGGRMGSPVDAARLKDVPVWVFNGEHDPTTTSEEAAIMVEALRRAGGKPQFTILPGMSHGDSQDAAYRYPGLFDWMLSQRRPAQNDALGKRD